MGRTMIGESGQGIDRKRNRDCPRRKDASGANNEASYGEDRE